MAAGLAGTETSVNKADLKLALHQRMTLSLVLPVSVSWRWGCSPLLCQLYAILGIEPRTSCKAGEHSHS